jgi:hypothetical protein
MERIPRRLTWGTAFVATFEAFAAWPPAAKLPAPGADDGIASGTAASTARHLEVYRGPGYRIDPNHPDGRLYGAGAWAIFAAEYDHRNFGGRYEDGALRYVANSAAHAFSYGEDPGEYLGRVQGARWA